MKIRLKRKQIFMLVGLVIVLLAIPLTVYLSQTNQNIRSEAAAGGKGKGKPTVTTATLTVEPSTTSPGSVVWVQGTGYNNTTWVEVREVDQNNTVVAAYTGVVWADGHIGFGFKTATQTGTFTMKAYQTLAHDKSPTLMAETPLIVQ